MTKVAKKPQIQWPDPNMPTRMLGRYPDRQRFYETPAGVLPSVTTFLKVLGLGTEALIRWSADTERAAVLEAAYGVYDDLLEKQARVGKENFQAIVTTKLGKERSHVKKLKKAAEIGTNVHDRVKWKIESMLGFVSPEPKLLTDQAELAYMAWEDWWNGSGYKPVRSEQPIFFPGDERIDGYAGTFDLLVEGPHGFELIDTKSSKGIYLEHHLQLSCYRRAVEAILGAPLAGTKIVRLAKNYDDKELFEVRELGDFVQWNGEPDPKTYDELIAAAAGALTAFNVLIAARD